MTNLSLNGYGDIRETEDGRYSVYDTIRVCGGKKNPRQVWSGLCEKYSEVVQKVDSYQFPGAGQKLTPVASRVNILYIIGLLPGFVGATYRKDAADLMCEKLEGRASQVISNVLTIDLIKQAGEAILSTAGLHPNLIAGAVANAIAKEYPQLQGVVEGYKKSLPIAVEQNLLTVTELSAIYAEKTGKVVSAIAMNRLLEDAGLQRKNPDSKNPRWLPVGQGNEFGQLVLETAKGRDKTIQSLKWYPSVVDFLVGGVNA